VESWIARLIIPELASQDNIVEYWVCLLSECFRLLQTERKQFVQTVIDPSVSGHIQILQRLGFKTKHHGMILTRDL
jgi:hypothetical protein